MHRLKTPYKRVLVAKDREEFDYDLYHPLVDFFEEFGGEVLVIHDNGGEGQVVVDLTCSCNEIVGNHLKRELAQYINLSDNLYARPPWHPQGISLDEVRARETFNRLSNGGEAEHPDDHPEVVIKFKQRPFAYFNHKQWGIDMGFLIGQVQVVKHDGYWCIALEEIPISTHTMGICFEDQTLNLGWIIFDNFIYGFPSLVHYLAKHGCTNFRYELVDFDQVRGD